MKTLLFLLAFFLSAGVINAQDIDSTKIPQTIQLPQRYQLYIISHMPNRGTPEAINYLNQVRAQLDTANADTLITVTVPSGFIRDRFQEMSQVPEGEASQYNENLLPLLGSQITNPWLSNAVNEIRQHNWQTRDSKIDAEALWMLKINLLQ